jgi:hypothetical protein
MVRVDARKPSAAHAAAGAGLRGLTIRLAVNIHPGMATPRARMLRRRAALLRASFEMAAAGRVTLPGVALALAPFARPLTPKGSSRGRKPRADDRALRLALLALALADVRERGASVRGALLTWAACAGVAADGRERWRRVAMRDHAELRATTIPGVATSAADFLEYAARAVFPAEARRRMLSGKVSSRRRKALAL